MKNHSAVGERFAVKEGLSRPSLRVPKATPPTLPEHLIGERFTSSTDWSAARPEHLVVCCSDGRWRAQVEEFLSSQVSTRADLYVVPGGPAGFNLWSSSLEERVVAVKTLRFLMEHHQLRAIWLIAHQDCAYYRTKLQPLDAGYILRRQLHDLTQTAESIVREYPTVEVHRIYAARVESRVTFTRLAPPDAELLPAAP